jgi:hypothetical protein
MSGADARQRRVGVGVGVGTAGGPATAPATAAPRAHQLHPHLAPPRQTGESWRARCRQETEHGSGPFEFRRNACRVACTVDSSPIAATEPSNTGSRGHALPAMPWHHRPEHRGVRSSAPRAPVTEDVSAESAPSTAPCRGSRSPAYQGRRPAASTAAIGDTRGLAPQISTAGPTGGSGVHHPSAEGVWAIGRLHSVAGSMSPLLSLRSGWQHPSSRAQPRRRLPAVRRARASGHLRKGRAVPDGY